MKEKYIKEVKRSLSLPRGRKKDIVRDLYEIFASAAENGETEADVAARLGPPAEYAKSIEEQLGIDGTAKKRVKNLVFSLIAGVFAVFSFAVYFCAAADRPPENAIGFAEGSTNISVSGGDILFLFLIIGALALFTSALGIFKIMKTRNKK